MAKTRLNQHLRDVLRQKARADINFPALDEAEKKAYKKAVALVQEIIRKRYPEKDMEVLRRYECTGPASSIRVQLTAGGISQFQLEPCDQVHVPSQRSWNTIYAVDDKTTNAVLDWITARDKARDTKATTLNDYYELIRGSRYLEDVMAVWPEVVALKEAARSTSLIVLSDDVIERIRADVERRKQNARA